MVPPCSNRISRVPPYSSPQFEFTCTGLSPATAQLSRRFQFFLLRHWPSPLSLATTRGVSVDVLSSRYLDVSVPWVCFLSLCIQDKISSLITRNPKPDVPRNLKTIRPRSSSYRRWVSPFGYLRINGCSHLPVAFRSVPRPSSPLIAKAFTRCP